jgi:hypothetical protein
VPETPEARAEALAGAARWEEAARAWEAIAQWSRAADAWRRDDRPAAALRALQRAHAGSAPRGSDAALFAGLLAEVGAWREAVSLGEEALGTADAAAAVLLHDGLAGGWLALGMYDRARASVAALRDSPMPAAALSVAFRSASLARLAGELEDAERTLAGLVRLLAPHPAAVGAVAAAWQERGEIAVLAAMRAAWPEQVDAAGLARAASAFTESGDAWARAGRRAGVMRAEAWALRARAMAGMDVLAPRLEDSLDYARARDLQPLVADLLACRALVRHDADDAAEAVRLLADSPPARGRARVLTAGLGGATGAGRAGDLAAACAEVEGDAVWAGMAARLARRGRAGS